MNLIRATGTCNACYLDGHYYKAVLDDLNIPNSELPILLQLSHDNDGNIHNFSFDNNQRPIQPGRNNYLRLVISSETVKHSTLLIINDDTVTWWNPKRNHQTDFSKRLHAQIKTLVKEYILSSGTTRTVRELDIAVPHVNKCHGKSGYCTAYVLKYAICRELGVEFTPEIEGFIREVINRYPKPITDDIEYDFSPMGGLVGGLAGGLIGGAVAGTGGALTGALLGGVVGGSSRHSKSETKCTSKWKPQYQISSHSISESRI